MERPILEERLRTLLELEPDLVSVFMGANNFGGYDTAQDYADCLKAYTDQIRASGARVVVATIVPRQTNSPRDISHEVLVSKERP